ncbi:alpha/beta fold hydrolase [Variovorax sp. Sphag1AA]|uniref:alpha/beta fold hydrolase n=1 Tax=Variovorax sp. Sphag1AA TaxID=2587027 RepID=UPI0017CD5EBE|nr:alpha/beta hydrolase [Variovorax sp. Sphag1AA]MBB3176973.1 3-oxoadipate enol-lactonase [Variovorax sp. Sphag1AA]
MSVTYRIPGTPSLAVDLAGAGPLALFMHGIGGNRTNWREQLPAFAPHFSCVALDARGYGGSDDYEDALAFDDFVNDVLRVLDHFSVERAHLVGLSMGGRIAMRTALLHPDRIATLTLLDTHEGFEAFSPEQRQAFVDSRRAPLLAGKEPSDIADAVARSLVGPKATQAQLQQLIDSIAALHKESYIKSLQATVDQVVLGDISQIRAPAHFVVGADDRLTPVAMHHEMAAKLGGAPVTVLPDAGHLSNIENAPAFNEAALAWLRPRAELGSVPRNWPL